MTLHCSSQTTNAMSPPWRRELQPTAWLPGCIGGAVLGSAATAVVMRSSPRAHSSRDHSRPHPDVGSLSGAPHTSTAAIRGSFSQKVTREELGRCTWTLLHTLASTFPDDPTRRQRNDVKRLVDSLSRVYPCAECSKHFQQVLKENPVQVGSGDELSQYMCRVHNVVNRSLGKPTFNCNRVDNRWGKLDCGHESACVVKGRSGTPRGG